jgi:hypothetical protein
MTWKVWAENDDLLFGGIETDARDTWSNVCQILPISSWNPRMGTLKSRRADVGAVAGIPGPAIRRGVSVGPAYPSPYQLSAK